MADVVAQLKKDPGSVKWGGGSRGSTEHIAAAMIAQKVGVDPAKINYVAFRGGGEATAAILGGNVTVGGSGYSEFAEYITAGKMKADRRHLAAAPEGRQRADAEGAGHQRRDRQLARRLWRARHHRRAAQGADRHGAAPRHDGNPGPRRWRRTTGRRRCWPARRSTSSSTTSSRAARDHGQGGHGLRPRVRRCAHAGPPGFPRMPGAVPAATIAAMSPTPTLPLDGQRILELAARSMFDLFANASEGMLLVDRDARVVWINEQYKRFLPALGYRARRGFRRPPGRRGRAEHADAPRAGDRQADPDRPAVQQGRHLRRQPHPAARRQQGR